MLSSVIGSRVAAFDLWEGLDFCFAWHQEHTASSQDQHRKKGKSKCTPETGNHVPTSLADTTLARGRLLAAKHVVWGALNVVSMETCIALVRLECRGKYQEAGSSDGAQAIEVT